ncbi:MAG TPA: FHA domain-containing protein [Anaerolineae bacterium]|nr:FHA domain-containing protein [Anaerolineae bacterium]
MTAGPLGASTVQRRRWVCSVCSTFNEPGARFCDHCGTPLPNSIGSICPNCRTLNLLGDSFCEQCGTALTHSPYLIITDSGQHVNLFHGDEDSIVIGRSDPLSGVAPDIDLNPFGAEAAGVSRRHIRLTRRDDQIWLEDLNSINLTYINNQRLTPDRPQALNDGDLLHLGRLLLTFRA